MRVPPKSMLHYDFLERIKRQTPSIDKPRRVSLDKYGQALLQRFGSHVCLEATAAYFPHIVNRLARAWITPEGFETEMQRLLISDRPNRRGLPLVVLGELSELAQFYRQKVAKLVPAASRPAEDTKSSRRR